MLKHSKHHSGHFLLIFLGGFGQASIPAPALMDSSVTMCFSFFFQMMWELERNECLLKIEFMIRNEPPSARLMDAQVSMPHTCGFPSSYPPFLMYCQCLTTEAKEWAPAVLYALWFY